MTYQPEDDFKVDSWRKIKEGSIWRGFFLGCLLHAIGGLAIFAVEPAGIFFIGALQIIYMAPALLGGWLANFSPRFLKGLVLAAALLLLLSGLCFGVVLLSLRFSGPWGG